MSQSSLVQYLPDRIGETAVRIFPVHLTSGRSILDSDLWL